MNFQLQCGTIRWLTQVLWNAKGPVRTGVRTGPGPGSSRCADYRTMVIRSAAGGAIGLPADELAVR